MTCHCGGDHPWVPFHVCVECAEVFTPIYIGQTRHPGCHTCQRPTASCVDCVGERRAHRRQVAGIRHWQLTHRLEGATRHDH